MEFQTENWSKWKVWCHPAAARDAIDESNINIMGLDKSLKEATVALQEQKAECERLSGENGALVARLEKQDRELAEALGALEMVRKKLDEAHEELELHKSVDEQLAELVSQLDKVDEMKQRYEKRIHHLEQLLQRERSSKRDAVESETGLDDFDVAEEVPVVERIDMSVGLGERKDFSEDKEESGKQEPGKKAIELQRVYKEKRAPGLPEKFPKTDDSDDWLLELPDNL